MGGLSGEIPFPLGGVATLPGGGANAAAANSLTADLPGGIGFIDVTATEPERLRVRLRFAEPTGTPTSDDLGGLGDLAAPVGLSYPTRVFGPLDYAAQFAPASTTALEGADATNGATALSRDLTVQAIMSWDMAAQIAAATPGTIIARGRGNSAVEYTPYIVELVVLDSVAGICELRFAWHTTAGVLKTQAGAAFVYPFSPSQFVQLTCTRRWVSPTEVVLRYYVNDVYVDEVVSVDGDIASSASGHTAIGARFTGAAYANYLAGTIDEIGISGYEMSFEEIEATWLRISRYQPDGYRIVRDNMPPGIPISDDPASSPQADLRSMGILLGFANGQVENFRQNLMPDRAYGNVQRRWERITEQPATQGDSLDRRRSRVVGHFRSRAGVAVDGIEIALAEVLDCQPGDLQVIAFDNTIRDDFTALREERWKITNGGVDVVGGKLRIQGVNATSYPWDGAFGQGLYALLPVEPPRGFSPNGFMGGAIFGSFDPHTLPPNSDAGFVLWSATSRSALFFGLRNVAGSYKVGYQRYENGIPTDGAWTVLATTALAVHYFRIRSTNPQPVENVDVQNYQLSYSTTDFAEASFTTTAIAWRRAYQWAGCYHRSSAALGSASDVRFGNDFAFRNTEGTRPFYFYVYRDPVLGGSPDSVGANRIIERMRHGYTYGRVITSKSLLAGDPASVVGGGPMGGI